LSRMPETIREKTTRESGRLALVVLILFVGWLAPMYAAKLCGQELNHFLSQTPVTAGLTAQCFWVVLFAAPLFSPQRATLVVDSSLQVGSFEVSFRRQAASAMRLGLPLGLLVLAVHSFWYQSFSETNVPTNTILWNTDTVTTPILAMLIAGQKLTKYSIIGGLLGLVGTCFTVGSSQDGNTSLGCGLCLAGSLGYAVNAVIVEKFLDTRVTPVIRLLACEGLVALIALSFTLASARVVAPNALASWFAQLPSAHWMLFMGIASLSLNCGWLWCTQLAGAFWTAMVACMSIPVSMTLDFLFFDKAPTLLAATGAAVVISGFILVSLAPTVGEDVASPGERTEEIWSVPFKAPLLADAPELSSTCSTSDSSGPCSSISSLQSSPLASPRRGSMVDVVDTFRLCLRRLILSIKLFRIDSLHESLSV